MFSSLGGRFGYFDFFFVSGGGDREVESKAKRGVLLIWNREKGGGSEERRRGGAHRGWEGVCGGGGVNIFLGAKSPTKLLFLLRTCGPGKDLCVLCQSRDLV